MRVGAKLVRAAAQSWAPPADGPSVNGGSLASDWLVSFLFSLLFPTRSQVDRLEDFLQWLVRRLIFHRNPRLYLSKVYRRLYLVLPGFFLLLCCCESTNDKRAIRTSFFTGCQYFSVLTRAIDDLKRSLLSLPSFT